MIILLYIKLIIKYIKRMFNNVLMYLKIYLIYLKIYNKKQKKVLEIIKQTFFNTIKNYMFKVTHYY